MKTRMLHFCFKIVSVKVNAKGRKKSLRGGSCGSRHSAENAQLCCSPHAYVQWECLLIYFF